MTSKPLARLGRPWWRRCAAAATASLARCARWLLAGLLAGCAHQAAAPPTPTGAPAPAWPTLQGRLLVTQVLQQGRRAYMRCSTDCPPRSIKTLPPLSPQPEAAAADARAGEVASVPTTEAVTAAARDGARAAGSNGAAPGMVLAFAVGVAQLDGPAIARLQQWLPTLATAQRLRVRGCADSHGGAQRNAALARARAATVAHWLRRHLPLATVQLAPVAPLASCYRGDNRTAAGRRANRYAAFEVLAAAPPRPQPARAPRAAPPSPDGVLR